MFNWFKKKKSNISGGNNSNTGRTSIIRVYDTITNVNGVVTCNCSSISTIYGNAEKVLRHFAKNMDVQDTNEILDGLKFVIHEFPMDFPMENMQVTLWSAHAILLSDKIQRRKLSPTCSNYGVTYDLKVGVDGMGWSIHTRDSMGDTNLYKQSKNEFYIKDKYTKKNIFEFINSLLNAMGYSSISVPRSAINIVKPKFSEVNKKSPEEEYNIGIQYFFGKEKDINWERAIEHFRISAEGGFGKGMYYYACCLLDGRGTPKDLTNGKLWLSKACEKNVGLAYERLGYAYGYKGDFEENEEKSNMAFSEAFELFQKDAETGDAVALYHLAMCYNYGHGVSLDLKKSIELLNRAIDSGSDEACYEMALLYSIGEGVERNDKEAFIWFKKAADMGNVEAYYNIGYCYESGQGVTKDLKKAFEWYMKGAQKKHAYSQYKVGLCFLNGIGTEKNTDNAFVFLNIAGKKGFEDAKRLAQQLL
jgi:TPR repeat protein